MLGCMIGCTLADVDGTQLTSVKSMCMIQNYLKSYDT
jgi:hypothetical protein